MESLASEVLYLFSYLLTGVNVAPCCLTSDNDVTFGSNHIHEKQHGTRFVFIVFVIQRSGQRKKKRKNNAEN